MFNQVVLSSLLDPVCLASHTDARLASRLDDCHGPASCKVFVCGIYPFFSGVCLRWITVSTVANTMEGTELFHVLFRRINTKDIC